MALMLGAECRKLGYEVELVEDLDKARLTDYLDIGKDVCVIFDDIFRTVRSHKDLSGIKHFLYDLHVYLGQTDSRSERRYQCLQQESRGEQRKLFQPHICVIFTAEASNLKYAKSKLGGQRIFIRSSYVQLCYTQEEKKELWRMYTRPREDNLDENIITSYENTTVGFPLACKLFSSCVDFQHEYVFDKPLFFIIKQLQKIIGSLDDKSAALILMVLCGGQLNIGQLETEVVTVDSQRKPEDVTVDSQRKPARSDSLVTLEGIRSNGQLHTDGDNQDLEVHLQAVTTFVKTSTRQGVAKALWNFCGTFLTEGNMMTFSHSLIYDVCASVLFSIEPQFTLRHMSVKFLLEHIEDQHPDIIPVSMLTIPLSEANREILVDRMADSFARGALTEYILHPIWRHEFIANKFNTMIQHPDRLCEDVRHHILCYACATGNTNILGQLVRHCDINRRCFNGWTPVMYAVVSEQMDCFDILVKHKAHISLCDDNNYNILHLACIYGHVPTVKHVKMVLRKPNAYSYTNQFLNVQARKDWTPIMCAVVFGTEGVSDCFIKPKKKTDKVKSKIGFEQKIDFGLRDSNNNTLLHLACRCGSKTTVENLLPNIDINARGNNGQTPILSAVLSGRKEVFDVLVSEKADIILTDEDNNSLLHAACTVHDMAMMMYLKTRLDINIRGQHGWTPAMKAAVNGNKDRFEHLLDPQKANLQTDDRGNNILHLACHGGNVAIVKQLLQTFDMNGRGNNGWTPVMFAAVNGLQSVFDLIVSKGADIRLRDNSNNSVLHLTCIGGNVSTVNSLLPQTDINCLGHKGRTAIMVTALLARPTLFELLLLMKANIRLADDNRDTILHLACEGGNCSIVKYLMRKFDINASGRHGRTPVMAAALAGMKDVFNLLVSQNAELTLTDDHRDSVLHLACQGGNTAIVEHLVTYCEANLKGQKGVVDEHTPRERPGDTITIVNEVTGGFDVDVRGKHDQTPLMRAVCEGHLDVYKFLVSHQADHTLVDKDGQTLLHLASRYGQLHVIEYIIDSVDINSRDKAGLTPVMTSVTCDKVAVFKYLREKGADLSLVDNAENDVLHLAYKRENRQMVELLEPPQKIKRLSGLKNTCTRTPSHPKKKGQ
ncbi:serine/threonine-protein phosphatase 6 regulatory ankyrin repeat subunit A-like [Haliotis rubra]|uniref:serine/threonine-protein phosphatase 6 regulatory ankyrin repeat subunit A-like n=1 Tax=Haliotis rubra TaxID=36100 RepID=UPI001EE5AA08|nr:serine/threonine-protein phosphatase 6 regulatory ankyrin repeat subunit A-like [Haliotis rubra]